MKVLNRFRFQRRPSGRPPSAVEITPQGVLAASLPSAGQETPYGFHALEPGVVVPSIDESNFHPASVVADAIRSALDTVNPTLPAVTVVMPDATTRVFILEFDSFPENFEDALAVLRFRLRKVVPFDVAHAAISYQSLPQLEGKFRTLVAVLPTQILSEYETAIELAGYRVGSVLPSGLATLAALNYSGPALSALLSDASLTTAITNGAGPLLYRTHLLPPDAKERTAELRRDIAVAAAYFEDQLTSKPPQLNFAGLGTAKEFAATLVSPELAVVDIAPHPEYLKSVLPPSACIAGVAGALAGAR